LLNVGGNFPFKSEGLLNAKRRDEAEYVQRLANAPMRPKKPQAQIDIGLFSDEANQLDLIEMFMD
jgi:hypothetical protein